MKTVTGNNPLDLTVIFPDYKGTELIDINCLPFKAVLEGPYLHPVFECTGKTFSFPDDCFVFTTL